MLNTSSPQPGIGRTAIVASGQDDTVCPIYRIACTPHPIGVSASPSSPNGINASPSSPSGITHIAVSGTAITLAAMK